MQYRPALSITLVWLVVAGSGCGRVWYSDSDADAASDAAAGDAGGTAVLIGHWPLDDTSGSMVADVSGHGHDGALQNGLTFSAELGYLHFDETDGYVVIPHSPEFLIDEGTLAFWFRAAERGGDFGLWSKDSTNYDTGGHLTVRVGDDWLGVRLQSVEDTFYLESGSNLTVAVWHHVAFTFGAGGGRLYVDGALVATNSWTGGLGPSSGGAGNLEPIALGASTEGSDDLSTTPIWDPFEGDLADVRLYQGALAPPDVFELASTPHPP